MKKGYIQHRGFSSHDTPENIKTFIDTGEFSAMLVSYNWLNPYVLEAIQYGTAKGLGVSVDESGGGPEAYRPIRLRSCGSCAELRLQRR